MTQGLRGDGVMDGVMGDAAGAGERATSESRVSMLARRDRFSNIAPREPGVRAFFCLGATVVKGLLGLVTSLDLGIFSLESEPELSPLLTFSLLQSEVVEDLLPFTVSFILAASESALIKFSESGLEIDA